MSLGVRDSNGKLKVNKEEALEIINDWALAKDFWTYDMESNREYLIATLDVLQNSIEGNDYSVTYQDSQNGSRLTIYCAPCDKYLPSLDPFTSHDAGKAHKKTVQMVLNKKESERTSKRLTKFKPLNTPKNVFDVDSLEDDLDRAKEIVLGLQFLYKEQIHGYGAGFCYTCQLCDIKRVESREMFDHLINDTNHNRVYISVKFQRRITNTDMYHKKCQEIETLEGKVNHLIIDFTGQFETLNKHFGRSLSPSSPPPSPGSVTTKRETATPPPLTSDTGCQTDTDDLDVSLKLANELALVKMNGGDEALSKDKDAMELMIDTLQTLNLKMASYYKNTGGSQKVSSKLQNYLINMNKFVQEEM